MVYKIILADRAKQDIQAILRHDTDRYTPAERLAYVTEIRQRIERLNVFPMRGTPLRLHGLKYWRMRHKAHTAFYRILDQEKIVLVVAVLHSRMNWVGRL